MASSEEPLNANRPFSIDLSLELENQLNNEIASPTGSTHPTNTKRESLDPHVLASIIMQLNQDKARLETERDDLVRQLSAAHAKEAGLTDSLDILTTKCTNLEEELNAAKAKAKDDDEAISMLRSKVEESRRGLMRLQTENRRQSLGPGQLDLSRASLASFSSMNSNKRQSFTPLTGTLSASRGHRRTSSHSDSPPHTATLHGVSPNGQVVFSDSASMTSASHPPVSSRRISGFFAPGRASPPEHGGYDPITAELDGLRRELQLTKDELADLRHELGEAAEAKEASEQCAAALRDFIAENNVGVVNIDKPTTTSAPPTTSGHQPKKSSGWNFSLWSKEPSPNKTRAESSPVAHPLDVSPSPAPKFAGLFGSRASVSSTTSSSRHNKSNATDASFASALSDTSSIDNDEPLSPMSEEPKSIDVIVRDPSRSSTSSAEYALETPVSKERPVPLPTTVENVTFNAL